jgi:hypothetical protein
MNCATPAATSEPKTIHGTAVTSNLLHPKTVDATVDASSTMDSTRQSGASASNGTDATGNVSTASELEANDAAAVVPTTIELKFERFPKLPPELRIKIWKLVSEPRIVMVRFDPDGRKHRHKFAASFPAILHACCESRHEGLKMYQRAFDSKWALNGVYFNFKKDTLCPDSWAYHSQLDFFVKKLKPSDLDQVESIVLRPRLFYLASKYPSLKEVIYMEYSGHTHNHMSTCSTGRGSFHSVEEFVEFNSENVFLCRYLERTRNEFTKFKKAIEGGHGARVAIRYGIMCTKGIPMAETYL